MKKWTAALLALVMALALTACGQTQQPVNGGTQQDESLPAPPDAGYTAGDGDIVQIKGFRSIDIEWVSGAVDVVLYDGEGIELTETLMDGGPVTQPMEWRVDEDDSTLDIRSQPQLVSLTEEKRLTVKLPRSTVLYELDIDAVSADVSVDLTEEDTLTLDELDVSSVSGTVTVHAANAGKIDLSTTSGPIGGSVRTGELDVSSVSGPVELALEVLPAKLDAETTSGNVTLTLAAQPDVPVCIVSRTVSGAFRSDVDSTDGAANVWKLETVSGNMTISAAK